MVVKQGETMTQEKTNNVDPKIYEEVIGKIAQQRNDAHNRVATLEIDVAKLKQENMRLKATIQAEKEFKKKDK